ncbi:hypothetical protein ACK3HF_23460 [Enterobacter kobei]|uniref:hypothetical protein n=1 Tax=Enterobacter kobei TaxID=208224 RepID=UPI00391779A8
MAADYITEQMEEQHQQDMGDFIAKKAAILIVTEHCEREAAIQQIKAVADFQDSHIGDQSLYIQDENGYPEEWLVPQAQFPDMPQNSNIQKQVHAVAREIRHLVD